MFAAPFTFLCLSRGRGKGINGGGFDLPLSGFSPFSALLSGLPFTSIEPSVFLITFIIYRD